MDFSREKVIGCAGSMEQLAGIKRYAFEDGKITTTRAFTARSDFAAPVILETCAGRVEKTFLDDHFANLLTHVTDRLADGAFEREYQQNLLQARLVSDCAAKMKLS